MLLNKVATIAINLKSTDLIVFLNVLLETFEYTINLYIKYVWSLEDFLKI